MLYADIKWREQYVSHALNRKFTGVIPTGVYEGFGCTAQGYRIQVGVDGTNTAVIETHGYSITLRMTEPEYIEPTAAKPYVVLEARYQPGVATTANLAVVANPSDEHLVLCRVVDTGNGWRVEDDVRSLPRIIRLDIALAQTATAQIEQMSRHLALRDEAKANADQAREDAQATARTLASSLHDRVNSVERVNEVQTRQNADSTMALAQTATASIATMARQVNMLDRLLAVEKAAG